MCGENLYEKLLRSSINYISLTQSTLSVSHYLILYYKHSLGISARVCLFVIIFVLFKQHPAETKSILKRDSNSRRQSRRRTCWALDHHIHGPYITHTIATCHPYTLSTSLYLLHPISFILTSIYPNRFKFL